MQRYNTEMDKAEKNTKELGKSSDNLNSTLTGLFTLALAQKVAAIVGEMVNLGYEANQTESRFRELTKGMGSYTETMEGLRRATLGIVDDMHLQQGAMLLVQTAGIENNAELERFMGLITRLKKPSEDMTTAIQNFGLMLANNSVLRLDSFGISASKVRARIIELRAELGVDRSEAFRMAVLEEGEKNLEKLGDSAEAAGTAVGRLGVKVTNAFQDLSQAAAAGLEGWALFFDYIDKRHQHVVDLQEQAGASLIANWHGIGAQLQSEFSRQLDNIDMYGMEGMSGDNFVARFTRTAIEATTKDPALLQDIDALRKTIFERMSNSGDQAQLNTLVSAGDTGLFSGMVDAIAPILAGNEALQTANDLEAERLDTLDAIADSQREINHFGQLINVGLRDGWGLLKDQYEEQQRLNGVRSGFMSQLGEIGQGAFSTAFDARGTPEKGSTVPKYLNREQSDDLRERADAAAALVDEMHRLDEENDNLFTDEELERVDSISGSLNQMADDAGKAADAFENMSLSEMFGQSDGGRIAEELDKVTEALERQGATETEIANAKRAFDLRTGKETWMSLAFDDQISNRIGEVYSQYGADAAYAMTKRFDSVMEEAQLLGIDVNSPDFVSTVTNSFMGGDMGMGIDMNQFRPVTDAALAAQDMNTALADAGTVSGDLTTSMDLATASADLFAGSMIVSNKQAEGTVEHVKTIGSELEKLSKTKTKIPVELEWVNPAGLIALILPGLAQWIAGAGGTMPGTDNRASTSGTLVRQGQGAY